MPYEFVGKDEQGRNHYVHDDPSLEEPDLFMTDEQQAVLLAGVNSVAKWLPNLLQQTDAGIDVDVVSSHDRDGQ